MYHTVHRVTTMIHNVTYLLRTWIFWCRLVADLQTGRSFKSSIPVFFGEWQWITWSSPPIISNWWLTERNAIKHRWFQSFNSNNVALLCCKITHCSSHTFEGELLWMNLQLSGTHFVPILPCRHLFVALPGPMVKPQLSRQSHQYLTKWQQQQLSRP